MTENANPNVGSRRKFLDWLMSRTITTWLLSTGAGALLLSIFYPAGRYLVPPDAAEAATGSVTLPFSAAEIQVNEARIFKFGSRPGILVRTTSGEFRAFSAACTHLGCIVQYRPELAHIWCACHNGHFDLNGRNIEGPPPSPLEAYTVNQRGDELIVSLAT